jgi:uncharacterized membrane protein
MKQILSRLVSIDMMRGLVMVLMALDHTRDYFSNAMFSPTDLSQTNAAYFLTRWMTHLCAPTFVFLAGTTSAFLSTIRWSFSNIQLSAYLIRRGLILIVLEFTVIRFGWSFNWDYSLRITNVYGDPQPWSLQKNGLMTLFSILNCDKYPPSLLYLLMTLGLMFFGLALFELQKIQRFGFLLINFGKTPLLFYVIHILLIHGAAYIITIYRGLSIDWLVSGSAKNPFPKIPAPEYGFDLATVYFIWLVLLGVLYPLCSVYIRIKSLRKKATNIKKLDT